MPILWKYDSILGIAYFCPHCKTFICSGLEKCEHCGGDVDWKNTVKYEGRIKWP